MESLIVPTSVFMTLGTELHEQMLQLGGKSHSKPLAFSTQTNVMHNYRPSEGMKGYVDLAQTGILKPDMWYGVRFVGSRANLGHVAYDEEAALHGID
ncbi:hypothetical protein TNCV_4314701 [Trichonephila clavipes]|nr:hypothetical protein TNCV_4314701 [Trichonephila clavipes]